MKKPSKTVKPGTAASRSGLPAKDMAQVRAIAAAANGVMNSRRKPLLLTGRNAAIAADAIARELRIDLLRIDLSAVVSKYIGETEKNLQQLFDAAERSDAVLFFDEADALFGKRSEVKDSHDRYANIEINFLLQRIEAYRGLAILVSKPKLPLPMALQRRFSVYRFPPVAVPP